MSLKYLPNGNLKPGIHIMDWAEFVVEYGYNQKRRDLLDGLQMAIEHLAACGCHTIYIDGSFVSKKQNPGDYDACWDNSDDSMDLQRMKIQYTTMYMGEKSSKISKYKGEVYQANWEATHGISFLDFFQIDKTDKTRKGIVQLNIHRYYDKA